MKRTVLIIFAMLLLLCSIGVLLYPTFHREGQAAQSEQTVQAFLRERERTPLLPQTENADESQRAERPEPPYAELLHAMQDYNAKIYANGQVGLADPWAYTAEVFDLAAYGLEDDTIAVLTIPKMNLQEPVYLGATSAHLKQGIAQLSGSSMPIGGENTNCVLAGHRGWNGTLFFRHIDVLEIGDEITLTNLWETLTYRVAEIKIIQPSQAEEILIQPGRDLLTLLTCHPYGSGGRCRYAVYCERVL